MHSLRLIAPLVVALGLVTAWCGGAVATAQHTDPCAAAHVRAASQRVERGLKQGAGGERVAASYEALLRCTGRAHTPEADRLLRPHVARTALLLPDSVLVRVIGQPRVGSPAEWSVAPEAGDVLAAWWRRQDPLPSTVRNERLEEHLARLAVALKAYPDARQVTGLDGRGRVYVRLGPPQAQHVIRFDDAQFRRDVFRFGVAVDPQEFPRNEIWLYPHIARAGYYLFVQDGPIFRVATAADLVAESLRRPTGISERDMNRAVSLLAALRYIYGQLALYHIDFVDRYAKVERYALWQENQQTAAEVGLAPPLGQRDAEVGAGREARQVYADPTLGLEAPNTFVQEVMTQSQHADRQAARRRSEAMPEEHAALVGAPAEDGLLPLAVRTARFLDDDGATRLEVYWSPLPGALDAGPGADTSLLAVHAVRLDADYRRLHAQVDRFAVTLPDVPDATLPPQTTTVPLGAPADTMQPRVHLQWDQRAPDGRLLRREVRRFDHLQPLDDDPARLQMSDLRPVFWPAGAALPPDPDAARPYPFDALTPHTALALVFDVYHLTYGTDDRTCARVTYEVEQDGQRLTGGTARRTYTTRRARDFVVVEPEAWREARRVLLRIRVQDCVSGRQVTRSLAFEVRNG